MNIARKMEGTTLVISVDDRLDTVSSQELSENLRGGLGGAENLVFDFTNLNYISSAGIRVLLIAQDMLGEDGTVKIAHANETVRTAFVLTGLSDLLED